MPIFVALISAAAVVLAAVISTSASDEESGAGRPATSAATPHVSIVSYTAEELESPRRIRHVFEGLAARLPHHYVHVLARLERTGTAGWALSPPAVPDADGVWSVHWDLPGPALLAYQPVLLRANEPSKNVACPPEFNCGDPAPPDIDEEQVLRLGPEAPSVVATGEEVHVNSSLTAP